MMGGEAPENGAAVRDVHRAGLAVHKLFCVGDRGPEGLADGLVAQAHAQDGGFARHAGYHVFADPGVRRTARAGGDDDVGRTQGFDLLCAHLVVFDYPYARIDHSYELVQIIGKAVVVVDQKDHDSTSPDARSAPAIARALLMHSSYSFSGTLSATMPAPACTYTLPSFFNAMRMAMHRSMLPAKSI